MAGGKGTRITSVASDIPKPMIQICGKPVLQYEIEFLAAQGMKDIIITVGHLAEHITDYFGDGSQFGVKIEYFIEDKPLGNAGALFKLMAEGKLTEDFVLLIADAMFDIDFQRFISFHQSKKALASLFTHPNSHPYDSGLVVTDSKTKAVVSWLTKEDERPIYYKNRVNAGLHILSPEILRLSGIKAEDIGVSRGVDLDRDILKPLVFTGRIFSYDSPEYCKDMGTPDRLYEVCSDVESGRVQMKNLKNKQKAIFLDRDGTINKFVGFLRNIDDFELLPGVAEAIKRINDSGYLAVVVTNQSVIARGEVTVEQLRSIHNKMETLLGNEGAYLDAIYYCPHHPDKGYDGEVEELKIDCDCRKPKPGMLLQAAEEYNIDLSQSWIIGDSWNDVNAGINAGCYTALILSDEVIKTHPKGIKLTASVHNLLEFAKLIQFFERFDLGTVKSDSQYMIFNRVAQRPLFVYENFPNGRMLQDSFSVVLRHLLAQPNPEDCDILSMDEYLDMLEQKMSNVKKANESNPNEDEFVDSEKTKYDDYM